MSGEEERAAKKARTDVGASAAAAAGAAAPAEGDGSSRKRLRVAVVCSSNQNRSMEAHLFLSRKGFNVESFGSGAHVKIPGPSVDQPNVYEFGKETYDDIYNDLVAKDRSKYEANGMLDMVDRNRKIKEKPERFQDTEKKFDVVITCETRVFDQVTAGLEEREPESNETVHVCNVEIKDNHESATLGAHQIVDLCERLQDADDLDDTIDEVLEKFESTKDVEVMHSIAYY